MIVAGDVGGTKAVLALFDGNQVVRERIFAAASFGSFDAIVDEFVQGEPVSAGAFGVAGPVDHGVAKITNLPWVIFEKHLSEKLGGAPVALMNDLQATAYGHLEVGDDQFAVIAPGDGSATGTIGVIAPGTGLGEAVLIQDGDDYRALPTEAGHCDFAPTTEEEIELLRFMRKRHGEHVSWERVLCGAGIGALYDFVRSKRPATIDHPELANGDRNAIISRLAIDGTDPTCVRALEMFVELLGAEAGNLALRTLAKGGVSLGGGIPPKILPALQTGRFAARFVAKGRFGQWMSTVRVRVCLEPRAAVFGAARIARRLAR